MIGGKVIGIARTSDNTLLHVQDNRDTCSVRVLERRSDIGTRIEISLGDSVWWQCGKVYWTPVERIPVGSGGCGKDWDIAIPKVGYSH